LQYVSRFIAFVGSLWSKGCLGKAAVVLGGVFILGLCGSIVGGGNRATPGAAPTAGQAAVIAPAATLAPTEAPAPTAAPAPTLAPTVAPVPTDTEAPAAPPTDTPVPVAEKAQPTAAPAPRATIAAPKATAAPAPSTGGVPPISALDCPADHAIKGNKASDGRRLYHMPGIGSYDKTKPERCFATEAEAQAAGYVRTNH
jgi:hypothetical protein